MKLHKKSINIYLLFIVVICVFTISIGYSSLNAELTINGDAYVRVDKNIRITGIDMISATNQAYETYNATYSADEINSFVTLPNINSKLVYEVTVVNKSSKKYYLENIIRNAYTNTNINYSISGLEIDDVINENSTITFTVQFSYKVTTVPENQANTLSLKFDFREVDNNLPPNRPVLASNMIPVYYDSANSKWRKADRNNVNSQYLWYDYNNKIWANVVTVSSSNRSTYLAAPLGTEILMDDINTMFVWIPRFNAVIPTNNVGNAIQTNPAPIQVSFVKKSMQSLEAFNFGGQALSGFWIAKFENSATVLPTQIDNTTKTILIKPNLKQWTYSNINSFFQSSRNMSAANNIYGFNTTTDTTLDTHMIKNTEWGATIYLTHSKFGKCTNGICAVVYPNNCKNMLTGFSSNLPNDYQYGTICQNEANSYNGSQGVSASTTGNIYGVYDMRGGINEYVMGVYSNRLSESGFTTMPESKYYTLYTTLSYQGHALSEIGKYYNNFTQTWFAAEKAWFLRGGFLNDGPFGSIFYYYVGTGVGHQYRGSRVAITI